MVYLSGVFSVQQEKLLGIVQVPSLNGLVFPRLFVVVVLYQTMCEVKIF